MGVSDSVESLTFSGSHVFLGGLFTSAGRLSANRVAQWTWGSPEGSNSLAGSPGDVVSLTGEGFIGVPATGGVYFGGVPSPAYTRDDSTAFSGVVVPSGISGPVPIEVDAVGCRATIGTFVAPGPPPPPTPADPPTGVTAVAGDASASVSWVAPVSSGSYPVTNYLVTSSPGGRVCPVAAPALSCTVAGLSNGTSYTFIVQALTGAGWSPASSASNAVTPTADPSIVITGAREGRRVVVSGSTTGFGLGGMVTPWIRLSGGFEKGSTSVLVLSDGSFTWQRRLARGKVLAVYFEGGGVRSNVVVLR